MEFLPRSWSGLVLVVGCGGSSEPVGELTVNRTAGVLEAGGEYTVHLIILSVPEGRDLEIGETLFEPCEAACQNGFYLHVVGTAAEDEAGAWIGISTPSGSEFGRETGGDAALDAWFDELIASVGSPRTGSR